MKDNVHLLKQITGERILGEFTKIVDKGGSVKTAFKLLANVGFFETFKIHTNKTMTVTDADFKTLGDFMYLLLFFEKDMDKILAERFKADNDTKKQVKALAHMHSRADEKVHARTIAAEMVKITPDAFSLGFIFSTVSEVFDMMKSGKLPSKITDLEISGDDMMELGFEGKGIGDGLKSLFDMVLFEKIPNDHSVLMSVATKMKNPKSKMLKGDVETFKNQAKLMSDKVKSIDMQIVSLKQKKKEMKRGILKAELEAAKSKVWYEEYLVSDYMKLKQKDMEENELMQELTNTYENRPVEEKHLNFEQFLKLLRLRIEKEESIINKQAALEMIKSRQERNLQVGDPVWIDTEVNNKRERIGGYLTKINKDGSMNIKSGTLKFENIKNSCFSGTYVMKRTVEDFSKYEKEISESLKKVPTGRLVSAYKSAHPVRYGDYIHIGGKNYKVEHVKAEMNLREDVPTKNIAKQANKSKTITK